MLHKPEWDKAGHHHTTVVEARACEAGEFDAYDDAPTCWICDGVGHGYPGAGPCPLESQGYDDHRAAEDYERSMGITVWV